MEQNDILEKLDNWLISSDLKLIKSECTQLIDSCGDDLYLKKELTQIVETITLERTLYYIKRLKKSLTEVKMGKINDLNLNRWKEYDDIVTDSLWVMNKRDNSGSHNAAYWGNFIPEIPNQFLKRYTKKGDWVLDTFAGSGTTLIECNQLGSSAIGIDLNTAALE